MLALEHRDDLKSVRVLVTAAAAERKATWWGGLGPQAQVGYQAGGITGSAEDIDGKETQHFGLRNQKRFTASASWKLGLSTFGEIKSSKAAERLAYLKSERKLDLVKAEVVRAMQDGKAQSEVIGHARQQVQSAEEALRLTTSNVQAGTMTLLDVLHTQSSLASARLRYSEAVVRYNQAQISLLAALGIMDDSTLYPATQSANANKP